MRVWSLPTLLQTSAGVWRPWLVALLVVGWLIRWAAYRELTRRTPLDWPLAFIILWLPVNYWATADKNLAWEAVGYLVFGMAMYFALLNWPPAQRRPQIIGWLLLSLGVGLALMTPLMSAVVSTKLFRIQEIERALQQLAAQGTGTVNANVAAGPLVLTLPLFAAMAIRPDWRSRRWLPLWYGLMAVPVVVALILTQSRSAYPDVFRYKDRWFMYVFAGRATVIATSVNGRDFQYLRDMTPRDWGTTSAVPLPDGRLRLYAFEQRVPIGNAVHSFLSTDGLDWIAEPGVRLRARPDEQITDPFVIPWRGGWKMYFKTSPARPPTQRIEPDATEPPWLRRGGDSAGPPSQVRRERNLAGMTTAGGRRANAITASCSPLRRMA